MEKWKTIDSKYIIQRPWATLRVDKLEMPNGNIKEEYYVLEYPTWVNMVALTEDNQVIFVKQYRHGAGKIMVELPAGVVEDNEDPEIAARRELLEETGYAFDDISYVCELFANPATSGNITYTYLLTGGRKVQEQELDPSEDIEVVLMDLQEAKQFLFDNKIGQALHSSALFYTLKKLGEL
ncbi:NUDIX hydrolase [Sphingobacterium mizutaii NBRC 14946 = DSM 11724]|uniref:GDP-mannose pyrophosphatase n=2 Tax=Sphingobacterium mizutaii TaxID=1010 RepID=A0AAJ5BYJ5_9SPHI|nr:NUDIX hydrolase [Sphingobacterium mizutaii]GEM66949.1 NUDIX hydrolase [Sphingobacterium mizutaii NBRC 14946 = DSM 11724]SDL61873.1 NUDIX domain-containing protein [Sphingobacterium mizutaii]SNV35334.1 ADP-ribose pyrophosphatase [Sphingobacterium mizutaii]